MRRFAIAFVLVHVLLYAVDYACAGCLQERRPVECDAVHGNLLAWWRCVQ